MTTSYVLLSTDEYYGELNEILNDETKFLRIARNPVENIKREFNKTIKRVKTVHGAEHLMVVTGDHDQDYTNGTLKTHKIVFS